MIITALLLKIDMEYTYPKRQEKNYCLITLKPLAHLV